MMIESGGERYRRKRHWGRWLGGIALALPVLLFIAHAIWGAAAGGRVEKRIAALRAAGEPVLPEDFATPPTGEDNGGDDILAAGAAIDQYFKTNRPYATLGPALPLWPEERTLIETALADLAGPLAQFETGLAKPRRDWDLNLNAPLIGTMLPSLNGIRSLCNLLMYDALLRHENGDHAGALHRLDQIIDVARFADKHPSLVGHLVAIGCTAMAADRVMEMAPDLKVGPATGEAPPEQVRALIARLLDDGPPREGLRLALRGERMFQLGMARSVMSGTAVAGGAATPPGNANPVVRYAFRPVFERNAATMLDYMSILIPLADEPDIHAVRAKLPPLPKRNNPLNVLANILLPSLDRAFETHYRCTSDRRLAATTLAIRMYQLDNGGKRPAKLEELVPKYLPAVPRDALLADKPLGYRPDAERPRLYSAGANLADDGGGDAFIKPVPGYSARRGDEWQMLDRCVYLDRLPRPAPEEELEMSDGVGDLSLEPEDDAATRPAQPAQPAP